MKRIAIIGANGFIGKHLSTYMRSNYEVEIDNYDIVSECELPNYRQIDFTNRKELSNLNLGVDYIFMFAGLTGTYAGFNEYEKYVNINEVALLNLLDTVRQSPYRPKIIFPSTRLVYKGIDKPLREEDEKDTKTIYAVNKIACEGYLKAYRDSFDIPYTIFRICIPYGNLLSSDYSFGTIGFFIKQAKAGNNITLYGGGGIKRTFTHMEDLCFQIVEGAMKKDSDNQVFNVGGETLSLRQAAETVANRFGAKVVSVPWPERDLRIESDHTYFDDTKIQALLGGFAYRRLDFFSNDL